MPGRPNILFITAEDMCPHLGCYGDPNALSPHLDRFAAQGVCFTNTFSVHPCCSPSRSCLATGVYPTQLGTFQHRARMWVDPQQVRCMTALLREAGYYTFNGMQGGAYKTDYNFEPRDQPWDAVRSQQIQWRQRQPDQPFFGQVNLFRTHQSQYGRRQVGEADPHRTHDPARIVLPPYHPDTPAVREIWAEYHDRITEMDQQFAHLLDLLRADGLEENTIVIFLGDNGMGIPAGKIWLWEQGLHVPLLVRVPESLRDCLPASVGARCTDLVSFLDFAPTVLSLCGVEIPHYMPGRVFLGPNRSRAPRTCCFAARDFHDGADFDTSRAARDQRFHYLRNFMPHQGWDAILYSWSRAPYMLKEWLAQAQAGALDARTRQACFFSTSKPAEELYDIESDPGCMHNLADDPAHHATLLRMRAQCRQWMIDTGDLGLLSQYELYQRAGQAGTPYQLATDQRLNPVAELLQAAEVANAMNPEHLPELLRLLTHDDAALRRWGAIGLLALGAHARPAVDRLLGALGDPSPDVQMLAGEALCGLGRHAPALDVLRQLLHFPDAIIRSETLLALVRIGEPARALLPELEAAMAPCLHDDIASHNNIHTHARLLQACLGGPCDDDGSMIDYPATRVRECVRPVRQQ